MAEIELKREPILFFQPQAEAVTARQEDPILAELRQIRLILQSQRGGVDLAAEEDPQVKTARARQAASRPTWHAELVAGQELDVVKVLGSIALTGFLLATEPTTFVYRTRRDGEISRPFTLPAGGTYDFGKGVAWIKLITGRGQVGLD